MAERVTYSSYLRLDELLSLSDPCRANTTRCCSS